MCMILRKFPWRGKYPWHVWLVALETAYWHIFGLITVKTKTSFPRLIHKWVLIFSLLIILMSRHCWWTSSSDSLWGLWESPCYNTACLGLFQMLLHSCAELDWWIKCSKRAASESVWHCRHCLFWQSLLHLMRQWSSCSWFRCCSSHVPNLMHKYYYPLTNIEW